MVLALYSEKKNLKENENFTVSKFNALLGYNIIICDFKKWNPQVLTTDPFPMEVSAPES